MSMMLSLYFQVSMSSAATAATRHWVNSVSDIYGPDEIEELLADLNKLELAQFDTSVTDGLDSLDTRPERIQRGAVTTETFDNFDIDGSVHQGPGEERGLLGGHEAGPASPLLRPSSPGGMSWNSHTHYHQFKVSSEPVLCLLIMCDVRSPRMITAGAGPGARVTLCGLSGPPSAIVI